MSHIETCRYIDEYKVLDPCKGGHRPHHSTETPLMRIHDDIMQALDRRKGVILVIIDITAAFHILDHAMLLKQMKFIGFCESALAWVASYLSDRTLAVQIDDATSRRQQLNWCTSGIDFWFVTVYYLLHATHCNIRLTPLEIHINTVPIIPNSTSISHVISLVTQTSFFSLHSSSSFSYVNEYPAIDSSGYVYEQPFAH